MALGLVFNHHQPAWPRKCGQPVETWHL